MPKIAFVGLGAMGGAMAQRLLAAGHSVTGYNRTRAKAEALAPRGLAVADSARAAVEGASVVLSMVTDSEALRDVALRPDGILAGLGENAVWAEMSTVSPTVTRMLGERVAEKGAALLDAPVSGSTVTIAQGQLSFIVGGDAAALERIRPYLLAIGPTITHVGALGLAVTMKIAVNLSIGVQMLAFSESVLLAEKSGIPREKAVEAILKGVTASPMLKYRGPFVLDMPAEALFTVVLMQKDMRLALEQGRAVGVPLPATGLVHELLTGARGLGLAEKDFAAVFDVLAKLSGLPGS
ncbi:MAG TPA: NAD(P)-dependent oxidoreductase [Methylomirabilota bacterium]|jgi:3-hydroxyisobutyrate dehydrogenase|nr:NAD(P)-dependent oxidoreductase [Methylomirabilota bacterium]